MPRHPVRWTLIGLAILCIAFLLWHFSRPKPVEVTVKTVSRGVVERTVANTRAGTVKACRRAKLSPSIGGQIAELPIREGEKVKAGQLLLELWNEDVKAQVALAAQEVASARSRSRSACLKADVAQRSADRLVKLRRKDVVPEDQSDNAVTAAASLRAQCEGARTEVGVREAQLDVAKATLERTRLVAPFDGVIAEINGERFEFVTPSPLGVPTPPVVDIIDNGCFYVSAPIDEVDAAGIRVQMPARVSMDAFGQQHFNGHVRRIADYVQDIEKQARTVDVEVALDDPQAMQHLLAGYSADIEVILDVRRDVARVPTEAIMENRRVFVFQETQGRLAERNIRIGLANWDWTEVVEGLVPGELVVVNVDNPGIKDGVRAERLKEAP